MRKYSKITYIFLKNRQREYYRNERQNMNTENTDWGKSVTGVLIKENKVLLARHTYGAGRNLLIVPGGYINKGETPQEAVRREYLEETGVSVEPADIIAIRFNLKDWYVAFSLDYISGQARSDGDENSEVIWLDINEALVRDDVPELTKELIKAAMNENKPLTETPFKSREQHGTYSLYCK